MSVGDAHSARDESHVMAFLFSKSHITLQKWMILVYWWSDAARFVEVDEGSAINVYRWLREVCSTKFLQMPMVLGDPGVVVEIDESQFRHKPKVCQ